MADVFDILIAGGGPFGTAVAFRAREHGLNALVIDYDDLMKRIRDYPKDKLILPDYGGGDQMQFPTGGPLISRLQFGPIDKDALCASWKALYTEFQVPARTGVEFTGLERQGEAWSVITWNHATRSEERILARHVVLGLGRGVPRRLDVIGDVTGLAFGLKDPDAYVGVPACVIGGGTSAAEAVIAISRAKAKAKDTSAVYWSYRGDSMPKVSRALAEVFFESFMVHGNVRYLPKSDPVSISGSGADACLAIRTSRTESAGEPTECVQLEFLKRQVVACIGEDVPTSLLTRIGVPLLTGGDANKTRITVSPVLETQQPDVYLAGDTLSPIYFEADDFGNPAAFREMRRRGNIKAAMRDGVLLADVIRQKLAGRIDIDVTVHFEGEPPEPAERPGAAAAGVASAPAVAAPPVRPRSCSLVAILPSGTEANEYPLPPTGSRVIGRLGDLAFAEDGLLSDRHASIGAGPDGVYTIRDEGSGRGTYVRLASGRPCQLPRGALVKLGGEWLRFGDAASPASLAHFTQRGEKRGTFELREGISIIGRQSPDITLATADNALSRRHCEVTRRGDEIVIRDLNSANGTVVKVVAPIALADGDRLLVGQQEFRFSDDRVSTRPGASVAFRTASGIARAASPPPPAAAKPASTPAEASRQGDPPPVPAPPPAVVDPQPGEPSLRLVGPNRQLPCSRGQSIYEALEAADVPIRWECLAGECGLDLVRICRGAEHLSPPGYKESNTLKRNNRAPGEYRYACMARVSGPVEFEIPEE